MSDQAFGGRYEIVGSPGTKRRLARFHAHAELRPIAERLRQWAHLDLGHNDATQPFETALDGGHLAGDLFILGQVLPITPPASECHLRTRWQAPPPTRRDDVHDPASGEVLLLLEEVNFEDVVEGGAGHEHNPPILEPADSLPANGKIVNAYAK